MYWLSEVNLDSPERKSELQYILFITVLGLIGVWAFIMIVRWDTHVIDILRLQSASLYRELQPEELREMQSICSERMHHDCALTALEKLSKRSRKGSEWVELGELKRKIGDLKGAAQAYKSGLAILVRDRLSNQDQLVDAHYGLARIYEAHGNISQAAQHYKSAINAKRHVIQITVTESYLSMLVKSGRIKEARSVLNEVRRRGNSRTLFAKFDRNVASVRL